MHSCVGNQNWNVGVAIVTIKWGWRRGQFHTGLFPLLFISQDKRSREYVPEHTHTRRGEPLPAKLCILWPHQSQMVCAWSMSTVQAHTSTTCTIKNKLWLKTSAGDGKGTEKVLNKDKSTSVKLPVPQGRLHTHQYNSLHEGTFMHWAPHNYVPNQQFKTGYFHIVHTVGTPTMHIRTYVRTYDLEETSHLHWLT